MNPIIDDLLVALVLLIACVYAVFSLAPKRFKARSLNALAAWLVSRGLHGVSRRLSAWATAGAACGGCDTCGSVKPVETRVLVSRIGRRRP